VTGSREPRFCYLVFCHRQPELVARIARAIRTSSPGAEVVLRHDRAGDLDFGTLPPRTHELVSQIAITWGSWAMVAAQLEALTWVREHLDPDWVVLVSGQDHPLVDLAGWERQVVAGGTDALVAAWPLDPLRRETRTMDRGDWLTRRYTYRWRAVPHLRPDRWSTPFLRRASRAVWYRYLTWLQVGWAVNEMPRGLPWRVGVRLPRRERAAFVPWYGEQWMALGRAAVNSVLRSADQDTTTRRRFEQSLIPDESYFQTVLCSDADLTVADRSLSWKHFTGSDPHPREVTLEDLPAARVSGRPFVRKVDATMPAVLDALDRAIGGAVADSGVQPDPAELVVGDADAVVDGLP